MTYPRWLWLLPVLMVLTACGFHLQGSTRLAPVFADVVLVADDHYTDFYQALRRSLQVAGSHVASSSPGDAASVEVLIDRTGQRVLSISATNTPTEYEVFYTIRYRVRAAGVELLKPQDLTLVKEYSFNETAVLEKEQEQAMIRRALADNMASLVLRQLAALRP
jgi:LPS-assembly lipoprotein